MDSELKYKLSKVKALVMDVDGVLTDGSLTFDSDGKEYKTFNAKDGQGIVSLNKIGIFTVIISARNSKIVCNRAQELGMTKVYMGEKNKLDALKNFMTEYKLDFSEILYIGDDLPDICILEKVGLSACPNDAVEEVKSKTFYICNNKGGQGAVRELCDLISHSSK